MKSCFVTGPVKSGTTLLISLLDSHPELALFPMEVKLFTHWIERFADDKTRYSDLNNFFLKKSKIKLMDPHQKDTADIMNSGRINFTGFDFKEFKRIQEERSLLPENYELTGPKLIQKYILDLHRSLCKVLGVTEPNIFVSKEGNHGASHLAEIVELFPQARFLVLVRDPRDIFVSFKAIAENKKRGIHSPTFKDNVSVCRFVNDNKGKNISSYTELYLERAQDEKFHFVKYENLVRKPNEEMTKIAHFLQIENLPSLQYPTNFGNRWGGNSSSMGEFKGVDSNRLEKWTQKLTGSERRIIEFFLHEYLTQANYGVEEEQQNRLSVLIDVIVTEIKSIQSSFRLSARGVYYLLKHLVVTIKAVFSCLFDIKYLGG